MKRLTMKVLTIIILSSFLAACSANLKAEDNSTQLSSIENNHEEESLSFMDLVELHLPDNVERTVSRSNLFFIGKYPGTTKYGIFHEKEEVGFIDVGEELALYGSGKIGCGRESHHAYVFFYSTSPKFEVKIIEIGDVAIDEVGEGPIPHIWGVYRNYSVMPKDASWYPYLGLPDEDLERPADFDEIDVYLEEITAGTVAGT